MLRVQGDQIRAFRLASHHLSTRLPAAAAACGIQDTPLNTATLAFWARVEALGPAEVGHALAADKSLLALWSVRGAPYVVPVGEAGVFTTGALPVDQPSFGVFLGGWAGSLQAAGLSATELLADMAAAAIAAQPGSDPRLARTDATVTRVDRWLGKPPAAGDRPQARAELARRFLHC